jgi:hypothetical protein
MQAGVGDNSELPSGVHHLIGDRPTPDPTVAAVLGGGEWGRRYSVVQTFKTGSLQENGRSRDNSDIID